MNKYSGLLLAISVCLAIYSCSNSNKEKGKIAKDSFSVDSGKKPEYVDTKEEIKVYNDFIDQVYRIRYCHLAMDSPDEYIRYNDDKKISRDELLNYKKKWNLYLKQYEEMLDTSLIVAFVSDSLYSLDLPDISHFYRLDSDDLVEVYKLLNDTIAPKAAYFILDSLKSRVIQFERPPYKYINWDTMPVDTALKYSDQNEVYWHEHVGNQVGNKYYIGAITMSRVKFNRITEKNSSYWRSIARNLLKIRSLKDDNIYVQNVCRNYFTMETSKNELWIEIAHKYWIPFLAKELDGMFDKDVPILMTTEFILRAAIPEKAKRPEAGVIYSDCISIPGKDNLFNRELLAFYRHPYYSLSRWEDYRCFVENRIVSH